MEPRQEPRIKVDGCWASSGARGWSNMVWLSGDVCLMEERSSHRCVCVCVCCQQTDMAMWHARTRVTNSGLLGVISSDTDFWGLVFISASFTFRSAGWPTSEKPTSNHLHLGLVVSRRGDKLSGCTRIWSKVIQWYSNNDDTFCAVHFLLLFELSVGNAT